jgi:hypothetical protein
LAHHPVLPDRDLRKLAMHIQPKTPARHNSPPTRHQRRENGRAGRVSQLL